MSKLIVLREALDAAIKLCEMYPENKQFRKYKMDITEQIIRHNDGDEVYKDLLKQSKEYIQAYCNEDAAGEALIEEINKALGS
jgi:hypothetical protein